MKKSVAVITPSIGSVQLCDAVESLANQSYDNVCHHIVCNGAEHYERLQSRNLMVGDRLKIIPIPDNTAEPNHPNKHAKANSFYCGHRIYAGYSLLVNSDYVAFLDEDNWFAPDHIASLVETIEAQDLHFAYALRDFYTQDKEWIDHDDCENLGRWPMWHPKAEDQRDHFIDTSCYLFTRQFLVDVAHLWYNGYMADFWFFHALRKNAQVKYDTNGKYTVGYRIDSVAIPNRIAIIKHKNTMYRQQYPKGLPWVKHSPE